MEDAIQNRRDLFRMSLAMTRTPNKRDAGSIVIFPVASETLWERCLQAQSAPSPHGSVELQNPGSQETGSPF